MDTNDALFEISWEVCNKVGGIHTVISSKANTAKKYFRNYFTIGPYLNNENNPEFSKKELPENYKKIEEELNKQGIKIHYGYWNINPQTQTFLIEYMGYSNNINFIKGKIWELGQVDSMNSDWYDFDEVMLWSWCCGVFIEKFSQTIEGKIIVHCHEWMAGGAGFYFKHLQKDNLLDENKKNKFKTVFTTHATMLGRALSGRGENLYKLLEDQNLNPEQKAKEAGVIIKHQTEKALANICDAFTTVSEITANEAEKFYDKKPDYLLYNGFDNPDLKFATNLNLVYEKSREKWNFFLSRYFTRFYDFNPKNTNLFFTSGRNEFRTKGIDIYINSLGQLNNKLKEEKEKGINNHEIINIFLIPIGDFQKDLSLVYSLKTPDFKRTVNWNFAPLSTHSISMDNEYIQAFMKAGLRNQDSDIVKVILIPTYLNGNDGIIDVSYYDSLLGFDLGIFASYYEPWGYTPLECISYGIPSVTSNLSGFGRAITKDFKELNSGVKILNRLTKNDEQISKELSEYLYDFSLIDRKELIEQRTKIREFANEFSWEKFYLNYIKTYLKVLNK